MSKSYHERERVGKKERQREKLCVSVLVVVTEGLREEEREREWRHG